MHEWEKVKGKRPKIKETKGTRGKKAKRSKPFLLLQISALCFFSLLPVNLFSLYPLAFCLLIVIYQLHHCSWPDLHNIAISHSHPPEPVP